MKTLPKLWCINRALAPELVNKWFNNQHLKNSSGRDIKFRGKFGWLHYPSFQNSYYDEYRWNQYTELSLEEFKTLVLKEAPVDNNEFVVGKWYKYMGDHLREGFYAKYSNKQEVTDRFYYSEKVFKKIYTKVYDWSSLDSLPVLLEDLTEIQKYLPENHIDKQKSIMKTETNIEEKLNKLQETFLKEIADLREACVDAKPIVPEYVECAYERGDTCWTIGKIYKLDDEQKNYPSYIDLVGDDNKPHSVANWQSNMYPGKNCFKLSTKEAFDKQNAKPVFKVGDYIKDDAVPKHMLRICSLTNKSYTGWGFTTDGDYTANHEYKLIGRERLATTEEIKEFLIRVAKEKGFVQGAKFHPVNSSSTKVVMDSKCRVTGEFSYHDNVDVLCNSGNIYAKGIWATILPQDVQLKFGSEVFTIVKGQDYAATPHGRVSKQQIEEAIKYIENPPKLNEYSLEIYTEIGHTPLKNARFGFGCVECGKRNGLNELKAILKAFGDNDF